MISLTVKGSTLASVLKAMVTLSQLAICCSCRNACIYVVQLCYCKQLFASLKVLECTSEHLCFTWPELHMACASRGLCFTWPVIHMACASGGLCFTWPVLDVACASHGLCFTWHAPDLHVIWAPLYMYASFPVWKITSE